ncbi:MAG TPA: 3-oxoacyl-ACP reductase family protein [Rhodoglobus sp.]|nr:3-oxoacyl-ACP reductase family protein [Rhodoglobus sp.]
MTESRVVLITGAGGGLGRAFAEGFAAQGDRVVVADIDGPGAERTVEVLVGRGAEALAVTVDVTSADSVRAMVDSLIARFGRLDVVVNNAAIYATLTRTPFTDIDPAEWDRVMGVNAKGTWLVSAAAFPHLTSPGGRIINIASATVMSGSPLWMHYVASKAAVIGMTRVMAREVGAAGVTVNAIAPGFTLTEASLGLLEDAETYGVDRGTIKRAGQPDDIVGTALFLASDQAGYLTGQTIVVDGGKQFL